VVDSIPGSNFDGSLVQFFDIELLPSGDNNPGARRIPGSHLEWSRSPGKSGSHYDPKSDLFVPNEAKLVTTSTTCWVAMLATLAALTFAVGPLWMFKLYVVPYWVSFMALFLHLFNLLPLHIRVCITFIDLVCI